MNLKSLVSKIRSDNKIPTEELISMLSEGIEEDPASVYMDLYKKAYGHHLSRETASEWVESIGETWSLDKTTEVGNTMGVDWNKINKYEFYAIMNAFHDDFKKTAKKFGLEDNAEFFVGLVCDYFNDEDAHDKTVFDYYFNYAA